MDYYRDDAGYLVCTGSAALICDDLVDNGVTGTTGFVPSSHTYDIRDWIKDMGYEIDLGNPYPAIIGDSMCPIETTNQSKVGKD